MKPQARRILDFIIGYKSVHDGCAPSIREIMRACGYKTQSAVYYWLGHLQSAGYIRRMYSDARAIEVVGGEWKAPGAVPARTQ